MTDSATPLLAVELIRWSWVSYHLDDIGGYLLQHVQLTVLAVLFGLLLAFPLALAAIRWPRLYGPILGLTGVLFTIPSLALFILLIPFTGLSTRTALIGLTIYTLLILVRNMVEGLRGVDRDVREAAEAMGYTPARQLFRVELPLALPVIMAGVRIATVTTIGLVTVTALIGQGGQGSQDRREADPEQEEHQEQDPQRGDGPALVGQVDHGQGASAGVADEDADGQGDRGGDRRGHK